MLAASLTVIVDNIDCKGRNPHQRKNVRTRKGIRSTKVRAPSGKHAPIRDEGTQQPFSDEESEKSDSADESHVPYSSYGSQMSDFALLNDTFSSAEGSLPYKRDRTANKWSAERYEEYLSKNNLSEEDGASYSTGNRFSPGSSKLYSADYKSQSGRSVLFSR